MKLPEWVGRAVGMAVGKEGPGVKVVDDKGGIIWQTPKRT